MDNEKVFCFPYSDRGNDLATMMACNGGMNGWQNNPFIYLVWMSMMGGGGFGGFNGGENFNSRQISALQDTINTNHNNDFIMGAVKENECSLKNLSNAVNCQTAQLQERLTNIGNGIQQGFSAVAYESQKQTCDIINAGKENTQRIIDTLNGHWNLQLSQALQDTKGELSQERQSAYIISRLSPLFATATATTANATPVAGA